MKKNITLLITLLIFFCYNLPAQNKPERKDSLSDKRLFKVDFIAPATGNFTVGYEQNVARNVSLDFELGIIGIGKNPDPDEYNKAIGLFLKAGPCLYISSNYYNHPQSKIYSCFQGTYIKPTLGVSSFSYSYYVSNGYYPYYYQHMVKTNNTSGALLLNVGHRFVFKRLLSFNFYAGMGYYIRFNNKEDDEVYDDLDYYNNMNYKYGYLAAIGIPVAFDSGVEIGLVLKH